MVGRCRPVFHVENNCRKGSRELLEFFHGFGGYVLERKGGESARGEHEKKGRASATEEGRELNKGAHKRKSCCWVYHAKELLRCL